MHWMASVGMALCAAFATGDLCAQPWHEQRGEHFIVHYQGDEQFAKDTLSRSEVYYRQIADDLGYARASNFWQWDNRVKIIVHPTEEAFHQATGQPAWSKGVADYPSKQITTYAWSRDFLEALLPHEIAHLIFRDFVGFEGEVPLWLDEGLAQYAEPKKRTQAKAVGRQLIQNGSAIHFRDLTRMDVRGQTDSAQVQAFYMQSLSVVAFMLQRFGADSYTDFCRQLRDGKSLEEALRFAYASRVQNLDDLERQWHQYVTQSS